MKLKFIYHSPFILLLLFAANGNAQSNMDTILSAIRKNNKTLIASQQYYQAQNLQYKTGLTPYNPTAEYDFLSGKRSNAGVQQEFTIAQSFDFPTAYIKKKQLANQQIIQSEYQFTAKRQDILLEAKKVCIDLVYHNKLHTLLGQRKQNTEKLVSDFQKKLEKGEGNILDVNKAQLQLIEIKKEFQENSSSINQLNQKLTELNGGVSVVFPDTLYPMLSIIPSFEQLEKNYESADPLLKILQQEKLIAQKQIEVSKAMYLPKAEVGYHYQGILGQNYNGIHTGITIPLWENKNTVKLKKAQLLFTDFELQAHVNEHYFHIKHIYEKYANLKIILEEYRTAFTSFNNTTLLNKSLTLGQISTIEYFMEMSFYNNAFSNYLQTEKELYEVIAELYKYQL
ncbi:MAG: transporter [Bacteroidetes bacterium RIFCSPLOWO2_12_FULL_35_15]|nr:MAG: transporter [Bacteroidetes bacterium RIFCSPLOWO2_12_FULL_35_15]